MFKLTPKQKLNIIKTDVCVYFFIRGITLTSLNKSLQILLIPLLVRVLVKWYLFLSFLNKENEI